MADPLLLLGLDLEASMLNPWLLCY